MRWDEKSSSDMRRDENSCDQLWRSEKGREDMRWDQMRWKKLERSDEMSWERWDDTNCGDSGMQWAICKMRCDEIRWNEKKINKSRACCCEAQRASLSPIGTVFVPLYRLEAFQIWHFRPRLALELLVKDLIWSGWHCRITWQNGLSGLNKQMCRQLRRQFLEALSTSKIQIFRDRFSSALQQLSKAWLGGKVPGLPLNA